MSHLVCTALLLLTPAADAKAEKYPNPDLLIEASELMKPEVAKKARILDTRSKEKFQTGHVPDALRVDTVEWGKSFGAAPDKDEWTKRLGGYGLLTDAPVVVYGDDVREAARVWFILRYWGFKDVRLLNGGWGAWTAAGGKPSTNSLRVEPTTPKLTANADRLATKGQVLEYLKGKDHQLIDARSDKEFCGEDKRAKRGGAIPGATNLEWSDLLGKDGRFKSADELAKLFKEKKVSLKEPAVTYCQSGGRAAVMAFALELMGAKDVRNYYRSWSEWGNDPDVPIVIPKKK